MSCRREGRGKDTGESERSCSSIVHEPFERHAGCQVEALQIEEVSIPNKRCNFSKRRSFTTASIKTTGKQTMPLASRSPTTTNATKKTTSVSRQYNGNGEDLLVLRNTLKSRIINAINLSIISESKNQSKLETPQCKLATLGDKQFSNKTTTFVKWSQSRKPSTRKQPQFNTIISFSDHSICDPSVHPCLTSFHQDDTINTLPIAQTMGFKEFAQRSCKLLPSIKGAQGKSPLGGNHSREKKNSVAKKIMNMQKIFNEKGIPLKGSHIDMQSLSDKKEVLAKLFERPQKSMIRIETTLESVVLFEASIDED